MALVIKKRVSLDFLGENYKEAYLEFQSLPISDYDKVMGDFSNESEEFKKKANTIILNYLKKYFIGGKFPDGESMIDVKAEDLDGLDGQSAIRCFQIWSGQEIDPKSEGQSTTQSITTSLPQ